MHIQFNIMLFLKDAVKRYRSELTCIAFLNKLAPVAFGLGSGTTELLFTVLMSLPARLPQPPSFLIVLLW